MDSKEFTPSSIVRKIRDAELKSALEETRLLNFRSKGRALYLSANDATWGWVEEHLGDKDVPGKGQPAFFFLQTLRSRFAVYARNKGIRLADLFSERAQTKKNPASLLREACLDLSQGEYDIRVRLRDLRSKLAELKRDEQDRILLAMQREGWLTLMSNDDPQDRNEQDDAASLVIGDRRRDLVYLHPGQRQ